MDLTPREMRLGSRTRGVIIAGLISFYSYVLNQPGASMTWTLLAAALLQGGMIILRKWVPPEKLPAAIYHLELVIDGITVLLFAIGAYGGILRVAYDA